MFEPANEICESNASHNECTCMHEELLKVHPYVKDFISYSNKECMIIPNEDDVLSCPEFEGVRNHLYLVSEKSKCSKCINYYCRHCGVHAKDKSFTCLNCYKMDQLYGICDVNVKNSNK